jgi:hypothetical protein
MQELLSNDRRRRCGLSTSALWLTFGLFVFTATAGAATPRDELLRLVPDSLGFCLVLQDLRDHAASLQASPFIEQLRQSPLGAKIRKNEDLKKLDQLEIKLKEKLGLDWKQLRDDILGDAVVLAYRPGPPGKPEQEQGLILVRARNAKALADLIERLNKAQKEEGTLKELEELRHASSTYYRRIERDKPPTFYYVHGPVLVVSSQEDMLRQAIDCDRTRAPDAEPAVTRRLRELDAERALFAMWINPRAFDAEIESKVAGLPADRVPTVKHFGLYWKALDSIVLSLRPAGRDVHLSLGMRARVEELPEAARRLFREASTPSELWKRFPEHALLAISDRLDTAAFFDVLGGFLTSQGKEAMSADFNRQLGSLLGGDLRKEVLPALGPDWGLCVTAPDAKDKSWVPRILFALRVAPTKSTVRLDRTLFSSLDFAARLVVFGHNQNHPEQPIAFKTTEVDKHEVHYLEGDSAFPSGVQPAYALLHGYLVLSSSIEGLRQFAQTAPASLPPANAPVPLVRISFTDWRGYLKERREPIAQFIADTHSLNRDAAEQQLDNFLASLQFVDRLQLHRRSTSGQVIFTLSVRMTQAIQK